MGWICPSGNYEALNGSCLMNRGECMRIPHFPGPKFCAGCNLEDRPVEGPTVFDCVRKQENCFHGNGNSANVQCEEDEKRYICAPGYHRTIPDNKCVENGNIHGCESIISRKCPPNTPDNCINGIFTEFTKKPLTPQQTDFFGNKIWGCLANNQLCPNIGFLYAPVDDGCDIRNMTWICRPGYYQALNGTCVKLSSCRKDAKKQDGQHQCDGCELTCEGCEAEDRPKEGPTVFDCAYREDQCLYDANHLYPDCPEYGKRHICAPGYHRVFPENKCVRTGDYIGDVKPGCDFMFLECPPNTPALNCPNGNIPDESTKKPPKEPQTTPTPVPEESSTGTPVEDPLDAYFVNRIWGCKANNRICLNLILNYFRAVRECAYEDMGWICRPGTYEALNGSCLSHYNCNSDNHYQIFWCPDCDDFAPDPKGATVYDCVQKEETCFPFDAERAANVKCEDWKYKTICAPGYHRVFSGNECVENGNFSLDKFYAKPGCKDFLIRNCPPNTHGICTSGIVPGEPYCGYTGVNNLAGPEPQLRSQLEDHQSEDDHCGVVCQCNEGFVRASSDMHSECIPTAECKARLHPKCRSKNEEFYRCPKRFDIDCPLLVNIDKDCGIQENFWVSTNSSCSVEAIGEMNCLGPAKYLCKPGYVRLHGKCVDIQECAEYRKQHPIEVDAGGRATGTIDGANRYLEAKKGK